MKQILTNLISNAIKFTNEGYVEIGCNILNDNDMLEFYVKDTGIGIKEENLKLIFERFRKIEDDKNQLHRGTGLGLAISSHLISLMGGTIYVTSEMGAGSVFCFTLPWVKSEEKVTQPSLHWQKAGFPDLSDEMILVAEDDFNSYLYLEKCLKKPGPQFFMLLMGKRSIICS